MGHRLIVGPADAPAGRQFGGAAQTAEDVVADDGEPFALAVNFPFHRVDDEGTGLGHPRHRGHTVVKVLGQGGLLAEGPAPEAFHHPQVRVERFDQGNPLKDDPPVDAVHGQDGAEEQAHPHHRGQKPPQVAFQVFDGQVHQFPWIPGS